MNTLSSKERLLQEGTQILLEHGYNDTGIQHVLMSAGVPKGSFYHHFESKEAFGLEIVNRYAAQTLTAIDEVLSDQSRSPIERVRHFFELVFEQFEEQGCRFGCLMGNLGQELSEINEVFRVTIQDHLEDWAGRIAACLDEAKQVGELSPDTDTTSLARLLIDGFQGAVLRMKLERGRAPLCRFLDHYFGARQG